MRVHFLPAEQQKRNDEAVEKLRRIGYILFVLLMATLALGAKLYIWPPPMQGSPSFATDDGIREDAIVLAPDLVLSRAKITGLAVFTAPGERRNARRISSTTLPDGTEMVLFRLESPTSVLPAVVVVIEAGDSLVSTREGQEWRGSVRRKVANGYAVDSEFTLPPGTAMYRATDPGALVGFGIRTSSGSMIVPAKDVVARFPELGGGR